MTSEDTGPPLSIRVLPPEVVQRIAAGEVVQKASAAVKELLENSLDAGATEVTISVEGLTKFTVSDNGKGISKNDLELAATRHATSKLRVAEDLNSIASFGFRGEALAAVSELSRLTLVSRTASSNVANKQTYGGGKALQPNPTPVARSIGTTVIVQDLFYNLTHRKKLRASDEYAAILGVVQHYAIHYAGSGVGLVCQKKGKNAKTDLNTVTLTRALAKKTGGEDKGGQQLTKQVIAQIFGSRLLTNLIEYPSTIENEASVTERKDEKEEGAFSCQGFFSLPSFDEMKRTKLVLFVNHRLVDSTTLKRALEDLYAEFTAAKPFLYLSLTVPADQVDVNMHPTKREVALLHFDSICEQIVGSIRDQLSRQGQSFSQCPAEKVRNPYKRKHSKVEGEGVKPTPHVKPPPSKLIRTSRSTQSGSLEPFVVSTQQSITESASQLSQESNTSSTNKDDTDRLPSSSQPEAIQKHLKGCPLQEQKSGEEAIDLSLPGAFVQLLGKCTCIANPLTKILLPTQATLRPKKIIPIECQYSSIQQLRKRVHKQTSVEWKGKLQKSCYIGSYSRELALMQCGQLLVLINHSKCVTEMFYQLALEQFGGLPIAKLGSGGSGGVDVSAAIAFCIQLEEDMELRTTSSCAEVSVSEATKLLASQATECLAENAEMLFEYFSISLERDDERMMLTGLPVLLAGYTPCIEGLPSFLFRLATQVNWSEEKPCFHGICQELGQYYGLITNREDHDAYIQHTIFPAVSTLFRPPEQEVANLFTEVTALSQLYKVFERC